MSSTIRDDEKVVSLPARRLQSEVERLARLPTAEWMFYAGREDHAALFDVTPAQLTEMVEAVLKEKRQREREAKVEEQRREQRAGAAAEREQERKRREQERERDRAEKAAAKKEREKAKAFEALLKLPKAQHEKRLIELATRLDEDLELLKDEFRLLIGSEEESDTGGDTKPWPDPVDTKELLTEVMAQFRRYVVVYDDSPVAIALWILFAWVHAEIAVHSPLLVFTSAEADSGKTTVCGVVQRLTPRSFAAAELTGPNLFRFVDRMHPTLIIDDADKLFERKPDLVHVVNVSWTRGTKIPRQSPGGVTRWFDPFCPKVIVGVNVQLNKTTATRAITIKLWPKLPDDKVERFRYIDDDEFITLRRKLARWAADHAATLKDARPAMPSFNNRAAMNWELLLAIADLAGGDWPKSARQAAIKLSRQRHEVSETKRLLAAFCDLFPQHGPLLTSASVQRLLTADPNSEWADFRGRGPISQRQIALLLDAYDIHPGVIHLPGRTDRGYNAEWFQKAFLHFLGTPANNRSTVRKSPGKPRK
jgi:putative DNA primase/helicase